ncbi:DEAD/DEAH box helicase family protein [Mycoplasmopsis lipofaciens]|uniref:DEAD/DEAH box helicase family protein n=1 Tax=Mycoplasmopsis lipofaciens TaxID=114884 RepID=UPI000484B0FB|nr:DEAD/DEAH box helicase family protein [Mycoplasmopsis lipofaciens]
MEIKLRDYQQKIIENWKQNNRCGLFQMCTGSGKTITAIYAIKESLFSYNQVPIILVPTLILLNQWNDELKKFLPEEVKIHLLGDNNKISRLDLWTYTSENINKGKNKHIILSTYKSALAQKFYELSGNHILLVCDEVHNIGSNENSKLLNMKINYKIGLSATPNRYFDENGTIKILDFFNRIIEPVFTLKNAIERKFLCEYYYHFLKVKLTIEEQKKFDKLSSKINALIWKKEINFDENRLSILTNKRSNILKEAKNKLNLTISWLEKEFKSKQHWLIYLNNKNQIKKYKEKIVERIPHLKNEIYEYYYDIEEDKNFILSHYEINGGILLAIKCLDEGVNIPCIDRVIIVASTQNEKEYIQRRGRVLRKFLNKNYAYIYDFATISNNEYEIDNVVKKEIKRIECFAQDAKNKETLVFDVERLKIRGGE